MMVLFDGVEKTAMGKYKCGGPTKPALRATDEEV
jgi:hypothetical protein